MCSWKYHRKHIFYLLLTFSHIFLVAKLIYNIIHSSIQKHKQNPEKKIIKSGQIERRRNRERRLGSTRGCDRQGASRDRDRREGEIAIGAKARLRLARCFTRSRSAWRQDHNRHGASRDLGDLGRQFRWMISMISADDLGDRSFGRSWWARLSLWRDQSWAKALSLSLSLSLSLLRVTRKWFEGKMKA